jgi:hypothetical protein
MAKTIDKLQELEYDEEIAYKVISTDSDLKKIVDEEFGIGYENVIKGMHQKGDEMYLENIFNQVILTKEDLIDVYIKLSNEPKTIRVEEKKLKGKKDRKLPRRYGKQNILKDIETQGGKMTPLQNAMLKVNDLKNIYVNLSARGIKDMVSGTNLLSDEDCRDIVSVVTIAERRLKTILQRKK